MNNFQVIIFLFKSHYFAFTVILLQESMDVILFVLKLIDYFIKFTKLLKTYKILPL